ncbi:cell wall metabolism sensor histidine kinase WalK [Kocuria sp. SM24M-10]|uniref:sensor histidine kinase n=1 Tax=Kocuria sp. SM24M-10 TaxID=1660349 RepID=UPI0009E61286|nr:HAMP domain-containing sensor histidine kinase [Kocuria sp. SM24M-10]
MTARRERGLAARFLLAQLLVVAASVLAAAVVASLAGPPLFHEHLVRAGAGPDPAQLMHVERAYRDAGLWTLGVALVTALACALAVSASLARRLRGPLAALTRAAQDLARGRWGARVPAMGAGSEVDALAAAFNVMAAELEATEGVRRRMLSDLAHEMRTPLSVLGVYLEGLEDGVTEFDASTGAVLAEQLSRLTRLVEDIDDVSRAEEGRMVLERSPVAVTQLLGAAADAAREAGAAKGVALRVEDDAPGAVLPVDPQRMGQVLGNLLSNALRHTPSGGEVVLGAARAGTTAVVLRVDDTGEGIAAEHLPHVFERFYRGDTARDREHGGSGIGLTISRALVEAHGGALEASSAGPGRGAEFRVVLPVRCAVPSDHAVPAADPLSYTPGGYTIGGTDGPRPARGAVAPEPPPMSRSRGRSSS